MKNSPLNTAAEIKFTFSEIDKLKIINFLKSEQPKGFWVIKKGDILPSLPGQIINNIAKTKKREEKK